MMQKDSKTVAFVCTGNTCRSPMAEAIFNRLADDKNLSVRAESFGISAVTGAPVSRGSADACAEIGIDLSKKTALSAADADIERYEKIFCMGELHARALCEYFNTPPQKIAVLNVTDPYGGDTSVYRRCRDEVYNSVKEIITAYENRKNDGAAP